MLDDSAPASGEVWHPWWTWEEVGFNMWGSASPRKDWLKRAIDFTGDHELYGSWMLKVVDAWKFSCEHNLTKPGDKRAWMGHAAVALAIQCPEDIVREAWGHLTKDQQDLANEKAQQAIDIWRERHA